MNLPAQRTDVWTLATDNDKLKALASFAGMPAQRSISPEQADIVDASYFKARESVTRYGLAQAVEAILQNKLGHGFFPSPPELRGQCDRAMEWHEREAERIRRREAIERDREPPPRNPSEGEKARVQKLLAGFYASYDKGKQAEDEVERAEVRARYGMTPELVDAIADQPLPSNFKQVGIR